MSRPFKILTASDKEIYVIGETKHPHKFDKYLLVLASVDGGVTWTSAEPKPMGDFDCEMYDAHISPRGELVVGGRCMKWEKETPLRYWVLLTHQKEDPLEQWSVNKRETPYMESYISLKVHSLGDKRYFVSTNSLPDPKTRKLATYFVADGTWNLVDEYAPAGTFTPYPVKTLVTPQGSVFVLASSFKPSPGGNMNSPEVWFVRRSLDFGKTWTTVDEF